MVQTLLLTGPEVIDVVRDVILIVFLVFAFFALVVFVVVALLLYRRVAGLIEVLTAAVERGDHLIEDLGAITEKVRRSGSLPGIAIRGALGPLASFLGGVLRSRGRRGNDSN